MAEQILGGDDTGDENADAGAEADAKETVLTGDKQNSGEDAKDAAEESGDTDHKDTDEKDKDGAADKSKEGAPDEYDIKLPEGITADTPQLAEALANFKQAGLSQEQAQKMVDMHIQAQAGVYEAQAKAWADQQQAWLDTAQADEEYGGVNFDENVGMARKALRAVGGPELTKALNETGMGSHPEFIRAFVRIGKAMADDDFSFGKSSSGGPAKSQAERIFPEHK